MPPDEHISHFYRESGGKNGDTISSDVWKGLMLDYVTLEQDAYGRVTAEDKGSVDPQESSCRMLICQYYSEIAVGLESYINASAMLSHNNIIVLQLIPWLHCCPWTTCQLG
jgi:hypothetical protein